MATLENYCSLEVNLVITVPRSHPGSTGPLSWVKAFTTSLRSHLQQDSSSPDSDQQVAPLIYVSPLSPPRFWGQAARQAACRVDELEHAVGLLPTLERPMRQTLGEEGGLAPVGETSLPSQKGCFALLLQRTRPQGLRRVE